MAQHNIKGHIAEIIARNYLRVCGYKIIENNYITGKGTQAGEIDIIAKKKNLIVFVEVKFRKKSLDVLYCISDKQKYRIKKAAEAFISKNPKFSSFQLRIDAILFSNNFFIKHIKNAF